MANDITASTLLGPDRRLQESIDTAKTLDVTDSGVVQNVKTSLTVTLPATVAGRPYTIRNNCNKPAAVGSDGTITITPATGDKIMGLGSAAVDNKAVINTPAKLGDEIQLIGDGVDGWHVVRAVGKWAREA